ncbi:MAG: SdpI family protein [Candidatus Magasanikbacteria bacterium]
MKNKTPHILIILLVIASVITGYILYPVLPSELASSWNAQGQVSDHISKFWGISFFPFLMLALYLTYLIIPKVDPLSENIKKFRKYYDLFWVFMTSFIGYLFALTLFWNLGFRFNFAFFMVPAVAALWFSVSILLNHTKRNWFIGIRTPWTLSNDEVWDKTHELGSKLFKIASIIALSGFLFPNSVLVVSVIAPAVIIAFVTVAYSYIVYQRVN